MWIIAIPEVHNSNFMSVPEKSKNWLLSANEIAWDQTHFTIVQGYCEI